MAIGCVYLATNTVNGSIYIGKTTYGLKTRRLSHECAARNNRPQVICCAIRKHGPAAFSWIELFCSDDPSALANAEIELIASYKANGFRMYNATEGGDGASRKKSDAEREAMRGRKVSEATRELLRASWTPERKEALAAQKRGRKLTDQQRKTLSDANRGKQMSEDTKELLRKAKLGKKLRPWTPERRAKMEAAWKRGVCKKSDATKTKISATKKARLAEEERARLKLMGQNGREARKAKKTC